MKLEDRGGNGYQIEFEGKDLYSPQDINFQVIVGVHVMSFKGFKPYIILCFYFHKYQQQIRSRGSGEVHTLWLLNKTVFCMWISDN